MMNSFVKQRGKKSISLTVATKACSMCRVINVEARQKCI